jgi:hypothetical protein
VTSRAAITSALIARKSTRAHRDEIVIRSCGTKSARIRKVTDSGGSSITLRSLPAPSGASRWNSSRIITLDAPSEGVSDASCRIALAWSASILGPVRRTSRTSGCSPRRISEASRCSASSAPVINRAAKARAAGSFVEPAGPTNR